MTINTSFLRRPKEILTIHLSSRPPRYGLIFHRLGFEGHFFAIDDVFIQKTLRFLKLAASSLSL
jgi:hypothetical protein